jgi:hypothetical protein
MVQIPLTNEQAAAINQADGLIVLVDAQGCIVGQVARARFSEQQITAAEQRANSSGPWRTTREVLNRLEGLH